MLSTFQNLLCWWLIYNQELQFARGPLLFYVSRKITKAIELLCQFSLGIICDDHIALDVLYVQRKNCHSQFLVKDDILHLLKCWEQIAFRCITACICGAASTRQNTYVYNSTLHIVALAWRWVDMNKRKYLKQIQIHY